MTRFVLRAKGRSDPLTFDSEKEPGVAFEEVVDRLGIGAEDVYSFWRVGKAFRQDSSIGCTGQTVSMWDREPGQELIFDVRELPELSDDARAILGGFFLSESSGLTLDNQETCLTQRSRSAIEELIGKGLLEERAVDNGYDEARTYELTEAGRSFPRAVSLEFSLRKGSFPLTQKIDCSASAESDRGPEPW